MEPIEKARSFIYRNARPLDFARWQYHFEQGSRENVLRALAAYQNEDGGFGHALEADSFNPHSCPIQTLTAAIILREIGLTDPSHPIIQGMLRYLDSGADFDEAHRQWLNVVPTNNDYPCAVWWKYGEKGSAFKYNPTAGLVGFILRFAAPDSALYRKACGIVEEAVNWLFTQELTADQHIAGCFVGLYEDCVEAGVTPFDREALRQRLSEMLHLCLDDAPDKWGREYAAMPSDLITSPTSDFYAECAPVIAAECDFIKRSQLPDGSFTVVWQWWNDHREYELAVNWWKSDIAIKNMLFLKRFDSSMA